MPDRKWRAGRKIASAVAAGVALLGIGVGAGVSQAATVPPRSHSGVVVMRNDTNGNITPYKLQYADPMTGTSGALPVGDGEVYKVHWTVVDRNEVLGYGRYWWGRMGTYRNGPVSIALTGSGYRYTRIYITLNQSWYGYTNGPYPAYGHGQHHTFAHTVIAVNDPTINMIRF
jgi:hypothetical protein